MPIIVPPSDMIEIISEKRLLGNTWATLDAEGLLVLVDDISKIEAPPAQLLGEQMYVALTAKAALSLRNLLNRPDVVALLRAHA